MYSSSNTQVNMCHLVADVNVHRDLLFLLVSTVWLTVTTQVNNKINTCVQFLLSLLSCSNIRPRGSLSTLYLDLLLWKDNQKVQSGMGCCNTNGNPNNRILYTQNPKRCSLACFPAADFLLQGAEFAAYHMGTYNIILLFMQTFIGR